MTTENKITALIVDDEPLARKNLRKLLGTHPEIEIVGEAGRLAEARARAAESVPDLIFLDIQLYGESGFDLLDNLPESSSVIFVTAFDRYAVRAFEVNALDYLLKPVTPARLAAALARHAAPPAEPMRHDDRVFLKLGRRRWFEPLHNILAICADNDHSSVWISGVRRVVVRRPLGEWEHMLPAGQFLRIHRHSIVNITAVRGIDQLDTGGLRVHLEGAPEALEASRRHAPELRRRIKQDTG
jgi:two-component system LytT family response regulator